MTPSFNPRTRTGCDIFQPKIGLVCLFQSTHPHGVRLSVRSYQPQFRVSIHAPARGATRRQKAMRGHLEVSIHAPARGATTHSSAVSLGTWFQSTHPHGVRRRIFRVIKPLNGFNPRTRTGCDLNSLNVRYGIHVSIHAPARGATPHLVLVHAPPDVSIHAPARGATSSLHLLSVAICFNPRTRTGCDQGSSSVVQAIQFQSTHPHGVRPATTWQPVDGFDTVSIHAPARGAT